MAKRQSDYDTVESGGRITAKHSMFSEVKDVGPHSCMWRAILCCQNEGPKDLDVVECGLCGKQRVSICNFDDEYS